MNNKKIKPKFTSVGFGSAYFSVAVVSILLASVIFSFVFILSGVSGDSVTDKNWYKYLSYVLTPTAISLSLVLFTKANGERITEVCRVNKTSVKYYLHAILLTVATFFGLSGLNGYFIQFLQKFGYKYPEQSLPTFSAVNIILTVLTVCVIPAVTEEAFFRGVLTRSLDGANTVIACLIGGLYFSLFHMNPAQTPYQFALGFCYTLLALKSGSVFPTVIAHFLNNLIIVILYYAAPTFGGFTGVAGIIATALGTAVTALFVALLLIGKKEEEGKEEKERFPYDYKTFFLYSAIGVAACVIIWFSGLLQ